MKEIEWFLESRHLCQLRDGDEISRLKHLCGLLTTSSELDQLVIECQGVCHDSVLVNCSQL